MPKVAKQVTHGNLSTLSPFPVLRILSSFRTWRARFPEAFGFGAGVGVVAALLLPALGFEDLSRFFAFSALIRQANSIAERSAGVANFIPFSAFAFSSSSAFFFASVSARSLNSISSR
jgi:uncharacterized membrane protein YjjP (DUF1212 family)